MKWLISLLLVALVGASSWLGIRASQARLEQAKLRTELAQTKSQLGDAFAENRRLATAVAGGEDKIESLQKEVRNLERELAEAKTELKEDRRPSYSRRPTRERHDFVMGPDAEVLEFFLNEGGRVAWGRGMQEVREFRELLYEEKDYDAAYRLGEELLEGPLKDRAQELNNISYGILVDEGIQERDISLAFKMAERASELTNHGAAHIRDTLATAYFKLGKLEEAVEIQTDAVEKCRDAEMRQELVETLQRFKAAAEKRELGQD